MGFPGDSTPRLPTVGVAWLKHADEHTELDGMGTTKQDGLLNLPVSPSKSRS